MQWSCKVFYFTHKHSQTFPQCTFNMRSSQFFCDQSWPACWWSVSTQHSTATGMISNNRICGQAISVLTFLVNVLLMYEIAHRPQLTFHHCLLLCVRYKMSIFQHQLGVVSLVSFVIVLCFYYCVSFFVVWAVVSVPRAFLSSPRTVLLMWRLFLWANENTYILTSNIIGSCVAQWLSG